MKCGKRADDDSGVPLKYIDKVLSVKHIFMPQLHFASYTDLDGTLHVCWIRIFNALEYPC